jgi:hypothetical protein
VRQRAPGQVDAGVVGHPRAQAAVVTLPPRTRGSRARYQRAKGAARHIVIESADPDTLRSRWGGQPDEGPRTRARRTAADSQGRPGGPGQPGRHGWIAVPVDGSQPLLGLLLEWRRAGHLWRGGSFTQRSCGQGVGRRSRMGGSRVAHQCVKPPRCPPTRRRTTSGVSQRRCPVRPHPQPGGPQPLAGADPRLEAQSPTLGERSASECASMVLDDGVTWSEAAA